MKYLCPICQTMQPKSHFSCASGAVGGAKSRRVLTPAQAKAMVAAREKNRAAKKRPPKAS